ncbi:MAG: Gfo/Idh/MocA family oxidoreductase, partial [Verrucomicrobiota bacterium]|nr:Gfo/Idh/MocA family oxidoreductase [Verrucomicrobiota bacterium]
DNNARCGANIVALCDVDLNTLRSRGQKYPGAALYQDFRKMLEKEKSIDAVSVSTPDHMHAVAAIMAMKMGKHVYVQKPLTQSVYEARLMAKVAKEQKVATQMGNQGSAGSGLRRDIFDRASEVCSGPRRKARRCWRHNGRCCPYRCYPCRRHRWRPH